MATIIEHDSRRFPEMAIALLKEYNEKLDHILGRAAKIQLQCSARAPSSWAFGKSRDHLLDALRSEASAYRRIEPALVRFARQVSQHLEHFEVDDVSRMELELRLAEFDAKLEDAEMTFQSVAR